MNRSPIALSDLTVRIVWCFDEHWLLLTAGENRPGAFNAMTVSWGGLGVLWGKPMALVVVRPSRYTYEFMERSESFTLCAFPAAYREALTLCGTRSGRSFDKIKAAGLTPMASTLVAAPAYEEAELVLECRKMYYSDLEPSRFLQPDLEGNYGGRDYHRIYLGEIVAAAGTADYAR
jgi:flavin reductase (DIM6/NTAB) family NADH-FMN oxidoreductase RutF